jgi:uncharacterized coiled-coil protein SlyX
MQRLTLSSEQNSYPTRPNRYNFLGWNSRYQYCYTHEDIVLLQQIEHEFVSMFSEKEAGNYFSLVEYKELYEFWKCVIPIVTQKWQHHGSDIYTLPTRESKDLKSYPLWDFSENTAKQIANWQSRRIKNQNIDLLNDPVMILFEELKNWFFYSLSEKECKLEQLELISQRQSYLKNTLHLIPNFGPDRLNLHQIQQKLDEASQLISYCIAKKELPEFLTDAITAGKSLETTIGTYLHFLLIDEEVSDNFSHDYLSKAFIQTESSPLIKIYKTAASSSALTTSHRLKPKQAVLFYETIQSTDSNKLSFTLKLKEHLHQSVRFAPFVTDKDKRNYVLVKQLLSTADTGLNQFLSTSMHQPSETTHFEINLRSLETRVAKGTTVLSQLEKYCANAVNSMHKYQSSMKKLVDSFYSGEASENCENSMLELFNKINSFNSLLPAMIDNTVPVLPSPLDSTSSAPKLILPNYSSLFKTPKLLPTGLHARNTSTIKVPAETPFGKITESIYIPQTSTIFQPKAAFSTTHILNNFHKNSIATPYAPASSQSFVYTGSQSTSAIAAAVTGTLLLVGTGLSFLYCSLRHHPLFLFSRSKPKPKPKIELDSDVIHNYMKN